MKLCMGCMNEIEDHITRCPICGFDETALTQESYYLDPGTVVGGKYVVGRVLDYGGYSVTYLGWDAEYGRKTTIREYLPSDFSTRAKGETGVTIYSGDALEQFEEGLATFLNEGNVIEHLPEISGIAGVYDCIAENDTGYIVSEYLEGKSLKELLDGGKKYELSEAMEMTRTLLKGLIQVHEKGVVHLDIAPENVIVTSTGEVKLVNFGATKYSTTSNSKSLAIILKPGYAPEEQYRSQGEKGPWSDVYAVAALMYRMLTGTVPDESVERAMIDNLKPPSELGVDLPRATENAILNAMNVYTENRTASAQQFLRDLDSDSVKRVVEKRTKLETGKFPVWAKGLIAALVCVIVAGGILIYRNQGVGDIVSQTATMIDTYSMDAVSAKKSIEELGAKCRIEYRPDESDQEGMIWMQSVEAGKAIDGDTLIVLSASGGDKKLTIPDNWIDVEKTDDIVKRLEGYHIACTAEEEAEGEKKGFHLISRVFINDAEVTPEQIATGEAVVNVGADTVKLYYYKPSDKNFEFRIPDFVKQGTNISEVEKLTSVTGEVSLADQKSLGYKPVPVYGVDMEPGAVVKQSASGNVHISSKKPLEVYYCEKKLSYRAGDSPTELIRTLKDAGIRCSVAEDTYSSTCAKGTIYSVIYPGGEGERYAKPDDTVMIHLSKGAEPAPVVPDPPKTQTQPQPDPPKQPTNPQPQPKQPDKDEEKSSEGM